MQKKLIKNYTNFPQYESRRQEVVDWLLKDGNNYCALPYTHMAIEANGDIRPCCVGKPFKNLNIRNKSIEDVWNDPQRQKFVDTFDKKMKNSLCNACWVDNDKHSMRVTASTRFDVIQHTIDIMEGKDSGRERSLKWLEIKPGNRCNLKCRICGVHNSSQWAKDQYQFNKHTNNQDKKFKDSKEFEYTASCDWIDNKDFWANVKSFKEISTIHFMGGEPFMVLEHFVMLKKLIEDPDVDHTNIIIRYNTNGTYFPTLAQLKIWKQFNRVILSISVDDINDRFEYQRSLASWKDVKRNLIKYKKLNDSMGGKLTAVLDPCVSIFNVWWIDEIEKEFNQLGYKFEFPHRHFVTSDYYDARVLPYEIKNKLIKKYKNRSQWQTDVAEFLESKNPHDRTALSEALKSIEFYDKLRKESFQQINNILYNEIRKYNNGTIT